MVFLIEKFLSHSEGEKPSIIPSIVIKMKKNLFILYLFYMFVVVFIWNSCTKEQEFTKEEMKKEIQYRSLNTNNPRYEQDYNFNNLAIVVSEALKDNVGFRNMIKGEAQLKFDGDYDILLKNFKDSLIEIDNENLTINEFLNSYYLKLGLSVIPFDEGFGLNDNINHLIFLYPEIQISVPIHADEWDETYNPVVTFIPEDFNEGETDYVIGYQDSTIVQVDAVIPPPNPVIVIGNNERLIKPNSSAPPVVNITLEALTYQAGIKISWSFDSYENPILGYHIYRKGNGTSNFEHIGDTEGIENSVYEDNNVDKLTSYSYFVKAFNAFGVSAKSNTVTIISPDGPAPVENFSALHLVDNEVELRWDIQQGNYIDHTDIYKKVVGLDNDYKLFGSYDPNTHHSTDINLIHGRRNNYYAQEVDDNGNLSNERYDFVIVPYRDITKHTPVRIEYIKFPCEQHDDLESYLLGEPEFRIAIIKGTSKGTTQTIQEEVQYDFSSNFPYQNCWEWKSLIVSNWMPSDWMEVYTFKVWEYDKKPDVDLTVNAGYNEKGQDKKNLFSGGIAVTIKNVFNSKDELVGEARLNFTNRQQTTLKFPNYKVRLYITEN